MKTPTSGDHANIDKQIAELLTCKPLPEAEVKTLCEKVNSLRLRPRKFLQKNLMSCPSEHPWSSVEISMGSSMILWNFSRLVVRCQSQTTSLWVTMLIAVCQILYRSPLSLNSHPANCPQSAIQRQNHNTKRKSRIKANHSSVWILRWMLPQVRKLECVEMSDWTVRFLALDCSRWKSVLLSPWRTFSQHRNFGQHQSSEKIPGSPSWRTHVRLALVRSWWQGWLGNESSRRWIHFWSRHCWTI